MPGTFATSVVNLALRAGTMPGRFVLLVTLAAYLPPAELGLYALIAAAVLWGTYLHGLEIYQFTMRELIAADAATRARHLRDVAVLYGLIACGAVVVWAVLFSGGLLPWRVFAPLLVILVGEHLAQEASRLLVAFQRPLAASLVFGVRNGAWMYGLAAGMVLVPGWRTLDAVLGAWMVGAGASVALAAWLLRDLPWRGLPPIAWPWLRRAVAVGLPFLVGSLAYRSIAVFERWYVGATHGEAALGPYGFYASIAIALPTLAESGVGVVLLPRMVQAWQQGDRPAYARHLRTLVLAFAGFLAVAVPGALLTIGLAVEHLGRPVYAANSDLFVVLLAAAAVAVADVVPQYALWARRRDGALIATKVVGLGVAISLDLLLVPSHGPIGAAWGQLGAMTAMLGLHAWLAARP